MKNKVLLIGGAGFIGHNLAIYLKKKNFSVFIIDNFGVNNFKYVNKLKDNNKKKLYKKFLNERITLLKKNGIKIIRLDARNKAKLKKKIDHLNPSTVVHLAAVSHDGKSNLFPDFAYKNSFETLFNLLDILKSKKKTHLVYLSSSMVYGTFKKKIVSEIENCEPIGIYGSLKLSAELLIKSFSNVFSLKYTIIRPSALYGERCISNRVIQIFLENAFEKKEILIKGDGKEKLDFTYIDDFCYGVYKILKNKSSSMNQTFNLTYGNSQSILRIKNMVIKKFHNQKFIHEKRDKLTAIRGTLSIKKAKNLLNYYPKFNIDQGFKKYYSWYEKIYESK